jgi:hypothetical protein
MPHRNVTTGKHAPKKAARRTVDPDSGQANTFNVGGDPIHDRDALGRPLRSSLTDTDQSGTGKKDKWIGPSHGENMTLPGPSKARKAAAMSETERDLKRTIELELSAEHRVDISRVHVDVDGTEVVLSGEVPERGMRNLAENLAQAVDGVTTVDNQLRVSSHGGSGPRGLA